MIWLHPGHVALEQDPFDMGRLAMKGTPAQVLGAIGQEHSGKLFTCFFLIPYGLINSLTALHQQVLQDLALSRCCIIMRVDFHQYGCQDINCTWLTWVTSL